jgi:hypothetical protein
VELQARIDEFRTLGIGIVALTYDAPEAITRFADERKIEFPILSDQDHSIVQRYGILNQQFEPGHRNYGIPHPGTFIVNREGRVVARYFEEEFQYRNTSASIALKIGQPIGGMGAATRQATAHLDLSAFLTDDTVAPGHRFSIVVYITPKPGMGVVAPGEHSYRVLALNLESSDNLRTYPVSYPASAAFPVAGGTSVPAYAQSVRLVRDVAVVVNPEMRTLAQTSGSSVTLKGVLEYQACSQTACEPPQQVPLEWTVGLKPLG